MSTASEYISTAIRRFTYYRELAEKTFAQLDEAELHFSPNEESNSIAAIIQHMHGNMMSRWTNFLKEDGEKEWRQRDEEFIDQKLGKDELMGLWQQGWTCFIDALSSLAEHDLEKQVTIRGEALSVTDAINRQLAHYPYHVGQIVYIGKILKNHDWNNLSIPRGGSRTYNDAPGIKDPSRKTG